MSGATENERVVPGLTNEGPATERVIRRAARECGTRPAAVQAIPTDSERMQVFTVLRSAHPGVAAGTLALDALDGAGGCGPIGMMTMAATTTTQTTVYSAWDELPDAGDGRRGGADAGEDSEELFENLG